MKYNGFSPKPPIVRKALCEAVSFLGKLGIPHPRLEAEVLLAALLEEDRVKLLTYDERLLSLSLWEDYRSLLVKRAEGIPLQYLTGKQEFMSLTFQVNPSVLIPRADTEVLVEKVLSYRADNSLPKSGSIVDVGTGSGAIAVSLAYYWPEAKITGVDISPEALAVARENGAANGVKVEWVLGDLLTPFIDSGVKFHLIVSNPPYIAAAEMPELPRDVQREPALALDGGPDGLAYYRRLIGQAPLCLTPNGIVAFEIGWDQGPAVKDLLAKAGFTQVQIGQDYAGRDRIVTAVFSG
ncbi:MAG: peptide chain release factor N(5)-glutamine methyltransferase [Clostridia bacterium]|jgi:release factor glutamine methyltransferase|nr:peptide chain release factor N(5)-glutamine methyltransferase [Clostridia bacterium]